ncbi:MAG: PIN domain-containing protein [Candidatus Gracilibacteria bacterium]
MIIDTNIIVAYLAGEEAVVHALAEWRARGGFLYLPSIVEAEILSFQRLSEPECRKIEKFLEENFIFISMDRSLARKTASLRRVKKIKLPDAAIAAVAMMMKMPLMTRNKKDFKGIDDLKCITWI